MLKKNILVLGGDGYIGWPLAMSLALQHMDHQIIIVDNFSRRSLVKKVGSDSLTPILTMEARLNAFNRIHNLNNLECVEIDITSSDLDALIAEKKPRLLYHLGQQPSAHYSMKGVDEALFTLNNNEMGNMRLLWAIRTHVSDAHLVKLGSFGEYANCGIDIAEGYFQPEYRGKKAKRNTPFPRESDDIYHISKINDTNYISMACRKWHLRVTDVMQATIFGLPSDENLELNTRFDYDEHFGTVINRFIAQAVSSLPLTIYGSGHQRTGLMSIDDAIASLTAISEHIPEQGQHQVINHVVEKNYSINELADLVQRTGNDIGFNIEINRGDS